MVLTGKITATEPSQLMKAFETSNKTLWLMLKQKKSNEAVVLSVTSEQCDSLSIGELYVARKAASLRKLLLQEWQNLLSQFLLTIIDQAVAFATAIGIESK